jgi:hypothetical protein
MDTWKKAHDLKEKEKGSFTRPILKCDFALRFERYLKMDQIASCLLDPFSDASGQYYKRFTVVIMPLVAYFSKILNELCR